MEILSEADVRTCVEAAIRAPSIHNTQPWLFMPLPDGVEVHADLTRRLPAIDRQGRAMHISLGAAVLNIRLALAELGHRPVVRLRPTPGDDRHVATVISGGRSAPTDDDLGLFAAIPERRSSRRPFTSTHLLEGAVARLRQAAALEGAMLCFTGPAERDAVLNLARTAEARQRRSPAYRAELRAWTSDDPYRDDGVPIEAVGPWSAYSALPIRDFAVDREIPDRTAEVFEPDPRVALLCVMGEDEPAQWLRSGQALQRVLLEATRLGLSAGMFTQPLEDPGLRGLLATSDGTVNTQVVLRFGYGPQAPASPRRPADEVIVTSRPSSRRSAHHR